MLWKLKDIIHIEHLHSPWPIAHGLEKLAITTYKVVDVESLPASKDNYLFFL